MALILQITTRDVPHSEALESHIREKAEKLGKFYPHIMSCRITVELPHKHKHQGRLFDVHIDITVPGSELVVNRVANEDVYVAVRDAFDAAKRQLEDYARRQRGDTKVHAPVLHGKITHLFKTEDYGFIETVDGLELYFHRDNLAGHDFDQLAEGDEVQFLEDIGSEGYQAKRISTGKHHIPGSE
ncbi:ribosome hibernation-promoting factor, HPF/YfiA family [Nitrosomonas sp. Nm166]|uniref:ribosome hibernation-promoting factor, HPF/YfiA family n=1 Tax=Nitrosomonas sp. Nm166 TaxID=1881054 RepID=UPI0008F25C49|nr:ribosome-associated translation inhibitor RaiA [Nitrosomonas sp. Nm166]SFF09409.1 ribosomal subunit interface protein [Nitrosomonas sp. Nm166]